MSSGAWEALELKASAEHFVMSDAAGSPNGRTVPVDGARQALWRTQVARTDVLDDETTILGKCFSRSIALVRSEAVALTWSDAV